MVSDPAALAAVTEGPGGVAAGNRRGGDRGRDVDGRSRCSPSAPVELPAETALVDAPVLGSMSEAESGALSIFVGGAPEHVARVEPVPGDPGRADSRRPARLGGGGQARRELDPLRDGDRAGRDARTRRRAWARARADVPRAVKATRSASRRSVVARRSSEASTRRGSRWRWRARMPSSSRKQRWPHGVDLRLAAAAASWLAEAESAGLGLDDYRPSWPTSTSAHERREIGQNQVRRDLGARKVLAHARPREHEDRLSPALLPPATSEARLSPTIATRLQPSSRDRARSNTNGSGFPTAVTVVPPATSTAATMERSPARGRPASETSHRDRRHTSRAPRLRAWVATRSSP